MQEVFRVDIWKQKDSEVSTDVNMWERFWIRSVLNAELRTGLLRRFNAEEVYSGRFLRDIKAGNDFQGPEIDYLYCAWF